MSFGTVVHEQIAQRDKTLRDKAALGRDCGLQISGAAVWCARYLPESISDVTGAPRPQYVSAALMLRHELRRRPTQAEVRARVAEARYPFGATA